MYSEFIAEAGENGTELAHTLRELGFDSPDFGVRASQNANMIYTVVRQTIIDGKTSYRDIIHLEPKTQLLWFPRLTRAIMFAFIEAVPEWKANNLQEKFYLGNKRTGKDNTNSIKFVQGKLMLTEIYKQVSEECIKFDGNPIPETLFADVIAANQQFPITNKTSAKKDIERYISLLKFLEAGVDFESALIFNAANVSYNKIVDSGFFNPDLPAEIMVSLVE